MAYSPSRTGNIQMDSRRGSSLAGDLIPIDKFLGLYKDATREILIYRPNIVSAADRLKCAPTQLEFIVRLHEYCHALAHIGVFRPEFEPTLSDIPTNWEKFISERNSFFSSLDESAGELLSQLLTWGILKVLQPRKNAKVLQKVFLTLMDKQRDIYKLDNPSLKTKLNQHLYLLYLLRKEDFTNPPIEGVTVPEMLRAALLSNVTPVAPSFVVSCNLHRKQRGPKVNNPDEY